MALAANNLSFNGASGTRTQGAIVKKKYTVPGAADEYMYISPTMMLQSNTNTSSTAANVNRIAGTQEVATGTNASQQNQMYQWLANNGYPSGGGSSYSNVRVPKYTQPQAKYRNYDWSDGSQYLTPDNPLVQPVVYNNEFSPESTMSIASDVYNEYYAPIVQQQQQANTQAYRNTAQESAAIAGASGMPTGSRGAIQAANQANREAQQSNLLYQQQMQLQAFQNTIDARNLELQNKIQDYQNAWEEVSQYGYVVTDRTGELLGIQPGQQLTTLNYKTTMSNIAANVANINAQKVELDQQQQQLDQAWIQFQEGVRQYEKDFAENQRQFELSYQLDRDTTAYSRLKDMLQRYDTVTPEMVRLGSQVGMRLTVGDSTVNYMSEEERLENTKASSENQTYMDNYAKQQLASSYLTSVQSTGRIANASLFSSLLADWATQGVSLTTAMDIIDNSDTVTINGTQHNTKEVIGSSNKNKDAAKQLVSILLGNNNLSAYNYYDASNSLNTMNTIGAGTKYLGYALTGIGAATLNPFLFLAGLTASTGGAGIQASATATQNNYDRKYYGQ